MDQQEESSQVAAPELLAERADPEVSLFTLPPVPYAYSICPFAIKLESFMRMNGIPYDTKYTTSDLGPKGTIPYVRLGGGVRGDEGADAPKDELLADSNAIISRLTADFGLDRDYKILTPAQRAVAHSFTRMIEEHTAQIGFHYRYGLQMEKFWDCLDIEDRYYGTESADERERKRMMWTTKQPEYTRTKTKYRGLSRHSEEELWAFSNDDLRAMSDLLGEKPFFFGTEATALDCTVFGHLVQFLYIPMDFPQKAYLVDGCPNLVRFVDNFRAEFWPDWDKKCSKIWRPSQLELAADAFDESRTDWRC